MVFSTIIFLLRFLPITLALYYLAPPKLKNTVLFLCSLVFYCWGEVRFFPVMLALILINYLCGLGLERFEQNKTARLILLLIALAVVLTLLVIWRSNDGVLSAHYNVTTTEGRITYLRALGWEADPATETAQEIVLPRTFDGVFGDYNALQKQQGFDLSIYAGETCSVYTYRVTNYAGTSDTVLAQLFVYRNRVIGGDIHATAMDGFMHGLR
mgnify:CR=1 FL=1